MYTYVCNFSVGIIKMVNLNLMFFEFAFDRAFLTDVKRSFYMFSTYPSNDQIHIHFLCSLYVLQAEEPSPGSESGGSGGGTMGRNSSSGSIGSSGGGGGGGGGMGDMMSEMAKKLAARRAKQEGGVSPNVTSGLILPSTSTTL